MEGSKANPEPLLQAEKSHFTTFGNFLIQKVSVRSHHNQKADDRFYFLRFSYFDLGWSEIHFFWRQKLVRRIWHRRWRHSWFLSADLVQNECTLLVKLQNNYLLFIQAIT